MKKHYILITGLLLVLSACKQHANSDFEKKILGEWIMVAEEPMVHTINSGKDIPPPPPFIGVNIKRGYIFQENNVCIDKLGYFEKMIWDKNRETGRKFLGTKTRYKIVDDSLKIFNLRDSTWRSAKILDITNDTLTLQIDSVILNHYSRAHYNTIKTETLEQIIVSSSGCFGTCPISNTIISNSGKVVFNGVHYNTRNGYFNAQMNRQQYIEAEENFNKSEIEKLNDVYDYPITDNETVTVTFIKNGKIFKTISDYAHSAPTEFYWAYTPIRFLYQGIELQTISDIPEYLKIEWLRFDSGSKICVLAQSESFYLWHLLLLSKKTDKTFNQKYKLDFSANDSLAKIITDGQYYKFELKNKQQVTLDLGFNFITRNEFTKRFKMKNEYE